MKSIYYTLSIALSALLLLSACNDEAPDVVPLDNDFPLRLELDADEGGTFAGETDYKIEIKFADFLGDLPSENVTLNYQLKDLAGFTLGEGDDQLHVKEVVFEIDDCTEGEFAATFSPDGSGTITFNPADAEKFEVVLSLPFETVIEDGEEEEVALNDDDVLNSDDRGFVFEITDISSTSGILFNQVREHEFALLDDEQVPGKYKLDITDEAVFTSFQELFAPFSPDLAALQFTDILEDDGERVIEFEFDFEEVKMEIETNEMEANECDPSELEAVKVEVEGEYKAEDGELEIEGKYEEFEDDGEPKGEIDFIVTADFSLSEDTETLTITFTSAIDEDNFAPGEEHFTGSLTFALSKD